MNWYDKIKAKITSKDDSRELKRGEMKKILLAEVNEKIPHFEFFEYRNSCYTFQNIRDFKGQKVFEHLHIIFLLKDRNFSCSIASRLNFDYARTNSYNTGQINPHVDLITLKKGTGAIPIEDAYYFHNGRVKTCTNVAKQIVQDYIDYGLPFLETQFEKLQKSNLVNTGMDFIDGLDWDKEKLKSELEIGQLRDIEHAVYLDLKNKLQGIKGNARELRKGIPMLAFEFLDLYISERKNWP